MSIKRVDNRGQISAEYLLLIVVILTVFLFMINNFIGPTIDASNDVSWSSDAKVAVDSVANAVNLVYANGPGSKRTLSVRIPRDGMNFQSSANSIQLLVKLSDQNKTVDANIKCPVNITQPTLNRNILYNVQVEWLAGADCITVNITAA